MAGAGSGSSDRAIRVVLDEAAAEIVGTVLMERLGPFAQEPAQPAQGAAGGSRVSLTFYPEAAGLGPATVAEVLAIIPPESGEVYVDICEVDRDWEEGWKDHFHPIEVGEIRIRPPWEEVSRGPLIDVVINPGMGFGTGLHPTTRGTLELLQWDPHSPSPGGDLATGTLVDAGTGSGVLAIAAAKLGWGPIVAFDNDPVALLAAAENVENNRVDGIVRLLESDVSAVDPAWFDGATVLANMTLDPVSTLLTALQGNPLPRRLIVSGILAGEQEQTLLDLARRSGFVLGRTVYEAEWVSLELLPAVDAG